jgi:heme o synthase
MKVEAAPIPSASVAVKPWPSVFSDLVKARLTSMVLLTTLVGYYLGAKGMAQGWGLFHALMGTGLVAAGASALNQLLERDYDALMRRTENRPLPSGRMQPATVLLLGVISSCAGLIYLATMVNLLTSLLGAITLALYVFIYTPLKRVTALNTVIGAVPGALPPLMGWTAATGEITLQGWSLFAILFFWQLPHFLAISWMYREEYQQAGYVMLSCSDPDGERTGRHAVSHTLGLLPVSLGPFLLGVAGVYYLFGALALGMMFFGFALGFSHQPGVRPARRLFYMSIVYLPLLMGVMVLDKIG